MRSALFILLAVASLASPLAVAEVFDGPPPASTYDGPPPAGEAPQYWVVFAAGKTPYRYDRPTTVAAHGVRRKDLQEAERAAIEKCQSSTPDIACIIVYKSQTGCRYLSKGVTPWASGGWGLGATPQDAYDACTAQSLDCVPEKVGGCADPRMHPTFPDVIEAPRVHYWRAFATAIGRATDGSAHVMINTAADSSEDHARSVAMDSCNAKGSEAGTCKFITAINHGCMYMAVGENKSEVAYTSGATVEQAIEACTTKGFSCDPAKAIGGCAE